MAFLEREEFFSRLSEIIGNDTSDRAIENLEDFTDTYNELEKRSVNDGEDWEQKYKDLDESWRMKYQKRFFNGNNKTVFDVEEDKTEKEKTPEEISFDDIIKVKESE